MEVEKQEVAVQGKLVQQVVVSEKNGESQVQEIKESKKVEKEQRIFVYGSCEVDQFYIDGERNEAKKPFQLSFFLENKLQVISLAVGGLHTLIVTSMGKVYSWGCNDDGALGRKTVEDEDAPKPGLVDLPYPVDLISAGDSHSCAANSSNGLLYFWGKFRDKQGNMDKNEEFLNHSPTLVGRDRLKGKEIQKLLSGSNHVLLLDKNKVLYSFGDSETLVIGRKPTERHRVQQSLKFDSMSRGVEDIWTGNHHSFMKVSRKFAKQEKLEQLYYSWGLNNYGQLGIGSIENEYIPQEIEVFRNKNLIQFSGGEHHSLALGVDGEVYAWGRNDDSQLGLGENWTEQYKQIIEDQIERSKKPERASKKSQKVKKVVEDGEEEKEKKQAEMEIKKQEEFERPDRIETPVLVEALKDKEIEAIYSGSTYNYAVSKQKQKAQIYSWGLGMNYQLGTGEDVESEPSYVSNEKFLTPKNQTTIQVYLMGLGGQHVVIVEKPDKQIDPSVFSKINLNQKKHNEKLNKEEELENNLQEKENSQNLEKENDESNKSNKKSGQNSLKKTATKRKKQEIHLDELNQDLKKINN